MILNVKVYALLFAAMLALIIFIAQFYNRPMRRCPNCEQDIRQDKVVCPKCRYRFETFRFSR
jgi:predicted amidophosphoribosyltransferase